MLQRTVREEKKFLFETNDTSICICHINYSQYILGWNSYRIWEQYPPLMILFLLFLLFVLFGFCCGCVFLWMSYSSAKLFILYQMLICTPLAHNCDMTMYLQRLCAHSCNRWCSKKLHVFKAFVNDVTNTWICLQCGFFCVWAWALKTNMILCLRKSNTTMSAACLQGFAALCLQKRRVFYCHIGISWIIISFRCFKPRLDAYLYNRFSWQLNQTIYYTTHTINFGDSAHIQLEKISHIARFFLLIGIVAKSIMQ